jgi:formylglycine-generating enzyme required for sulfatase activity
MPHSSPDTTPSRRSVLRGAALGAVGVAAAPLISAYAGGTTATKSSGVTKLTAFTSGYQLQFDNVQIVGPDKPSDTAAWLAAVQQWRADQRSAIGYDDSNYNRPELAWAQHNPIQPQMMVHDLFFYDRATGRYTVDKYLADVKHRYGGIDSVLVWPTYPNIGVDDRNTDQMFRDMPGGITGLRQMVADFNRAGVKVLFPIHPWDVGTRDPGQSWSVILPKTMAEIGADGMNGDTMYAVTLDYFTDSVADGDPLVLEPELGLADGNLSAVQWNTQSWGEIWNYTSYVPEVSQAKWLEPRHTVHVNSRWSTSKIDMLQSAFFNGTGLESWENVWGIWNQLTDRDEEAIRRVAAIEREFPDLLVSQGWEPHTPTIQNGSVFASKWPGNGSQTLWTLVNRSTTATTGDQLAVPYEAGLRYYDLWNGIELDPEVADDTATLAFPIEAKGFGAVLASTTSALPNGFAGFQQRMRQAAARPLSSFSAANTVLPQTMFPVLSTSRPAQTPPGMVAIPGADFTFTVSGTEIEGGDMAGVDVQYPWETLPGRNHSHVVTIPPFYIDRTEVTNAQYQQFMDAAHYRPADSHNFLKDWDWSDPQHPQYRAGWDNKPVTWVSLEDSRAYAAWADKRLPNEWEWQYAAQGSDGRNYPWGNTFDPTRVPPTSSSRDGLPAPADVTAYPAGASPFGVLDMVGNVWQWTNEFTDEHTSAAVVRGGSYYSPQGAPWYFPNGQSNYQLGHHNKYLLMAPSLDRSATIGFRTIQDAPGPAAA